MYDLGINQNRRKRKSQGMTFRPFSFQPPYNLRGRNQQSSMKFPSLFPQDTDRDGVPDYRDCDPDDPNEQGPIHDKLKGFINKRKEKKELETEDEGEGDWAKAKRQSQPREQPVQPGQNFQHQGMPLYDQLGKSTRRQSIPGQLTGTSMVPYGDKRAREYGDLPAESEQRGLQSREQVQVRQPGNLDRDRISENQYYYGEAPDPESVDGESIPKNIGGDTGPAADAVDGEFEPKEKSEKKSPKERLAELKQKMSKVKGKKKYYTIAKQSNGMWITDEKFDDLQDALKRLDLIEEYDDIVDVDIVNSRLEAEKRNVRQQITKISEKTEEGLEKSEEIKDEVSKKLPSKEQRKKAIDILAQRLRGTTQSPSTRLRSTLPGRYLGAGPTQSFAQEPRTPDFGMADTRVSFRDRTSDKVNPFASDEVTGYNRPENVSEDYQEESVFGPGVVPYRPIGRLQVSTKWQGKPYKPVNPFGIKLNQKSSRPKGMLPMAKFQFMNLGISPGRVRGGKKDFMMHLGKSEEY